MKICFVTHDIAHIGGQERVMTNLANILSEQGIDVTILITSAAKEDFNAVYYLNDKVRLVSDKKISKGKYSDLPYKLIRCWNKKIHTINNTAFLEKIYFPYSERKSYEYFFEQNSFDVVVGLAMRAAGMLACVNTSAKKIAWLHNSYERYFLRKNEFQWHQEKMYERLLPKLDKVVTLTDFDRKEYSERFNIDPIRIYNPLSYTSHTKSNLTSNIVLFVGRLNYKVKGLDLLAESIAELEKRTQDFKVVVVGDGEGKEQFLKYAESLKVRSKIEMIGNTKDVEQYYQMARVCVVPSRVEGFGLVVTEAFEAGVPVIAFDSNGPSELIEDGVNGYVVERYNVNLFAEKIYSLLMDENMCKVMGHNALVKSAYFSETFIGNEWCTMLSHLLSGEEVYEV